MEKEALSLMNSGYNVFLLCYTSLDKKVEETYKGININRFKINKFIRNKLFGLYHILPIYRLIWTFHIKRFIKKNKISVLHIHDLPLTNIGVKFKQKQNLKLVCDQHEFYSNWIGQTATYKTKIGRIIKKFSDWELYEKELLPQADFVITVSERLKQSYINKVGIPARKIINIPNTPSRSTFDKENIDKDILEKYSHQFVIFYVGGVTELRGLSLVIKSLHKISKQIRNIKLVIAGDGNFLQELKKLSLKENVQDFVEFLGYVSHQKIPTYIKASDVCIFTPPSFNDEINRTIATKIYQYLIMGKPIIVSNVTMMKNFVEENRLGFAVNGSDTSEFEKAVSKIYNNPKLVETIAENAKKINQNYYWEDTSKILIEYYNKL
ncbi:MAG: glycosyltransferase family 4 protein [Candidatus Cloacimonadota bacterium]|nr:glycosyltransferase family 4 protein [Candidatus Cloacimonadota bacterium]